MKLSYPETPFTKLIRNTIKNKLNRWSLFIEKMNDVLENKYSDYDCLISLNNQRGNCVPYSKCYGHYSSEYQKGSNIYMPDSNDRCNIHSDTSMVCCALPYLVPESRSSGVSQMSRYIFIVKLNSFVLIVICFTRSKNMASR